MCLEYFYLFGLFYFILEQLVSLEYFYIQISSRLYLNEIFLNYFIFILEQYLSLKYFYLFGIFYLFWNNLCLQNIFISGFYFRWTCAIVQNTFISGFYFRRTCAITRRICTIILHPVRRIPENNYRLYCLETKKKKYCSVECVLVDEVSWYFP